MVRVVIVSLIVMLSFLRPATAYNSFPFHPYIFPNNPFYYVPGRPIPPLANPFYRVRGAVCYAQSYNGLIFWGSGPNTQQANYNALNVCAYNTGYACYFAGCRWL